MIRVKDRTKKQYYLFRDYLHSLINEELWGEKRRVSKILPPDEYVTLESGEELPHALIYAGGYIFAGLETAPGKIIRFNPYNLSEYDVITFANDGNHDMVCSLAYSSVTEKIYTVFESLSKVVVAEIDPDTLEYSDVINDNGDVSGIQPCLTVNDGYIFVLTRGTPSKVLKYDISTYAKTSVTLTGLNNGHAISYDGENIYATGVTSPGWIAKINPTTLVYSSQAFDSGDNLPTDDFTFAGDYVYVGLEATSGDVLKISKDDLSSIERIETGISSSCYGVFYANNYIWATFASELGKIAKINTSTLEVEVIELEEDWCNELTTDGEKLFIVFYLSPAVIARLTL